jgi:hypothetical protein
MRTRLWIAGATILVAGLTQPVGATSTTGNIPVSATIGAQATLALSLSAVSFPNADPDTTSSIAAAEGAITITTNTRTTAGSTVTLTVLTSDDLRSGSDTIAIANVTWTTTGTGFSSGWLSKTTAQIVGQWTGPGSRSGTQTYSFANSWTYAAGTYSATATYTLTAP